MNADTMSAPPAMQPPLPHSPPLARHFGALLGVALVLLCLAAAGLSGWHLWTSRQQMVDAAQNENAERARTLERHLAYQFQKIDQTLLAVRDEIVRRHASRTFDPRSIQSLLVGHQTALPELEGLRVSDAAGTIAWPAIGSEARRLDVSDRAYFQTIRQSRTSGMVISGPLWGRATSHWMVIFARRIEDAQGAFLGGVYASMTLEAFRSHLADLGQGRMVAVLAPDETVLCLHPLSSVLQPGAGQRFLATLPSLPVDTPEIRLIAPSLLDGVRRFHMLRRMEPQGLSLVVGLPVGEVLAPWRRQAILTTGLTVLLLGLSLGLGILSRSIWKVQQEAQAQLVQQEAMYRLITESATEVIWTADSAGKLQYVSPSIKRQAGFTPQEFLALNPGDTFADPEGRALFREHLAATLRAESRSQPFEGRLLQVNSLRKDGSRYPAEIHLGILWDAAGGLQGIRGVTRDITRRKAAEAQRDELIEALTRALAELKTLKGMLPICCCCKKVRDDRGYWNQIEAYIAAHSEATFTHGYCPECAQRQFPEAFTE